MKTHLHWAGGKTTPEYRAWASAISKCTNPRQAAWPWYGAKGIRVCEEWRNSFPAFLDAVGFKPSNGVWRLERICKHGDFEPSNVVWIQRRRKRKLTSDLKGE